MSTAVYGVISNARGRQRRRQSVIAVLAACTAVAAGLVVVGSRGVDPRTASRGSSVRAAPGALFARSPWAGVACRTMACDSVGLAVWLRVPARSVTATIAGHSLALTHAAARPFEGPGQPQRGMFVGYLTPVRLVTSARLSGGSPVGWLSPTDPEPVVVVRVAQADGRVLRARLRVAVAAGWG